MLGRGSVPQVAAANNGSAVQAKATPPMTWNGTLVDAADTETYYLHLSATRCEKCNGPVIAGSLGTRHDHISKETDIRKIGAACIACGFMPEFTVEPAAEHRFRPVEMDDQWPDEAGTSRQSCASGGITAGAKVLVSAHCVLGSDSTVLVKPLKRFGVPDGM
jgi:hypothetical protein